jgi:hypothetical protein
MALEKSKAIHRSGAETQRKIFNTINCAAGAVNPKKTRRLCGKSF